MRRRADYLRIQSSSQRVVTPSYYFLIAPSDLGPEAPPRLGLIVTRKVGPAVVRNRIKRVLRECFRKHPGYAPLGVDLVVVARPGAKVLSLVEAASEWASVRGLVEKRAGQALSLARGATKHHVAGGKSDGDERRVRSAPARRGR